MANEVEIIGDGDGVVFIGEQSAVNRFLESRGLFEETRPFELRNLGPYISLGADALRLVSESVERSSRYLKLTKDSARRVRDMGLMPTKVEGVSHAMLGDPGRIGGWIQVEVGPSAIFGNPSFLLGFAGIMTQFARQQEVRELRNLLLKIDDKLDDVRRRQRDEVIAKMDRAATAIEEAMMIREYGGDCETAWAKVVDESGTIAEVQANALRAIGALTDKVRENVEGRPRLRRLANTTKEIEGEIGVWLAVLARCLQLKDEHEILELDHVLRTAPDSFERHRLGLSQASRERGERIAAMTGAFIAQMTEAGGIAEKNVLLHAFSSRNVINSINGVGGLVEEFQKPLGLGIEGASLENMPKNMALRDAIRDPRQLKCAGIDLAKGAGKCAMFAAGAFAVTVVGTALLARVDAEDDMDGEDDGDASVEGGDEEMFSHEIIEE